MLNRRVLFVHDGPLYTNADGSVYGIHFNNSLVERYRSLGQQVTFLMRGAPVPQQAQANLSLIDAPQFSFIAVPDFKSIRTYYKLHEAKKIIRNAVAGADIVVTRLPSAIGNLAMLAAQEMQKPCLTEFVACTFDAYWNYDWRGKLIAHYKFRRQQRIARKATHTVYVTDRFLQQRYPVNGKSIGCSDVMLRPSDQQVLASRLAKIGSRRDGEVMTLGTIAALDVPYKGQADVIRAVRRLKDEGLKFRYELIGQGNPDALQALIDSLSLREEVVIRGPLSHEQVFPFLDTIDLYIQPSKQEGLPRALVEAMSRACPGLGSNIAGIPELLSADALFQPGKPLQIARLLKAIDKNWLATQAAANFAKAGRYESGHLNQQRTEFFQTFLKDSHLL